MTININFSKIWKWLLFIIGIAAIIMCIILSINNMKIKNERMIQTEKNKTTVLYYDQSISSLKKQNKELYDSIKNLKNVESVIQFKYIKEFHLDTVFVKDKTKAITITDNKPIVAYKYKNTLKNDTLNYELSIGSKEEPNWYKLNVSVSDRFTIINRRKDNTNITTVQTDTHDTQIVDVTPIHIKKNTFWKRFNVSITAGPGYGIFTKKPDIYVGAGVSFNIFN